MANMLERDWLEDPIVRDAASQECLGIVWIARGPDPMLTPDFGPGAAEAFQQILDDLARLSGYNEIRSAPLIPTGHSAAGQFAWKLAAAMPDRTIAAVPIKTVPMPKDLGVTGIPMLYMVGQTTEWPQFRDGRPGDRDHYWPVVRDSAIALRTEREGNLIGVATEPGGGHFDWSERQARLLALFLHKACAYRLPRSMPKSVSVKLRTLRPTDGWLTDTGGVKPDRFEPAPYGKYRGDAKRAYWFFDGEMARAVAAFNGDRKERSRQMLTFMQDGKSLPVAEKGFAPLEFQPEGDGVSFRLQGTFLDAIPGQLVGAGTKLGAAAGPISFRVIDGPAVQTGPASFRLQFGRAGAGDIWIQEEHGGDEHVRRAVQPGNIRVAARLTEGRPQRIEFPSIPDQKRNTRMVPLKAVSDSGLAVDYYVPFGPAYVKDGRLVLTPIPAASHYPVQVTVIAYQYGRSAEPAIRSADPIARSFWIAR